MWTRDPKCLLFRHMSGSTATDTKPPAEAFSLRESISLTEAIAGDSIFDEDGCVPIHIIRPGVGKGIGHHLYEADMLRRNADKFSGWKMYVDHESPAARKAAGGLPRSTRDLGGRIVEAEWDPTVPADPEKGFGQGAVVAKAKPVPWIKELIENDPEILEASIAASATGVRPVVRGGQRVWLVEGIDDSGSVDWVTEAGAGGRVAALLEAVASEEDQQEMALLESLNDDELLKYVQDNRPELKLAEAGESDETTEGGAAVSDTPDTPVTPEKLAEALSENPSVLVEALSKSAETQLFVSTLVESKLEEERETIRSEARADADRVFELHALRDEATELIRESKLPESWQRDLEDRFAIKDRKPTSALDVVDDVDDEGKVTKSASEKLREAVQAEITRERERLAEVSPTRVRRQGPKAEGSEELKEGEERKPEDEQPKGEQPYWASVLQEAGVDPDKAYELA